MKNLLIIDGMALLFRHFFATSLHKNYMRNTKGVPTNGVQGFVRHVVSAIHDTKANHVIVCWDMGSQTFRNEIDPNYKAHRPAPQDELIPQFDMVQEISRQLGFHNIGIQNFEADDVIGTLAHTLDNSYNIKVISGDRDLLQILDEHIEVWLIKKGFNIYNIYTQERFKEEYQIEPKQLIDVKAFMGDTADGYPGVKGIGEKTAIQLIQKYNSVQGVLNNLDNLPKGQQTKIINNIDALKLSHQLAEIHTAVPLQIDEIIKEMPYSVNIDEMINICDNFELKVASSFIRKLKTLR